MPEMSTPTHNHAKRRCRSGAHGEDSSPDATSVAAGPDDLVATDRSLHLEQPRLCTHRGARPERRRRRRGQRCLEVGHVLLLRIAGAADLNEPKTRTAPGAPSTADSETAGSGRSRIVPGAHFPELAVPVGGGHASVHQDVGAGDESSLGAGVMTMPGLMVLTRAPRLPQRIASPIWEAITASEPPGATTLPNSS